MGPYVCFVREEENNSQIQIPKVLLNQWGFPYVVNTRQNLQVNRITNSFLYSLLLHIRDTDTPEVVQKDVLFHSHAA